jgi:hypothetical protein
MKLLLRTLLSLLSFRQTIMTKEKVSLTLDINTDVFWTYLKQRFVDDFAKLVYYELNSSFQQSSLVLKAPMVLQNTLIVDLKN